MDIYIHKEGQQVGPYSLEQVNEQLAQGTLQLTDLAFHEGLSNWTPLSQVAGVTISGALPPHPPVPQPAVAPAVSAQPNNTGKYLLFGGIAAGLLLLLVAVVGAGSGFQSTAGQSYLLDSAPGHRMGVCTALFFLSGSGGSSAGLLTAAL